MTFLFKPHVLIKRKDIVDEHFLIVMLSDNMYAYSPLFSFRLLDWLVSMIRSYVFNFEQRFLKICACYRKGFVCVEASGFLLFW